MRFSTLLVCALSALTALAAPVPTDKGNVAAGTVQPAIISHQPATYGGAGAQLQGRAKTPPAKALTVPTVKEMKEHLSVSPSKVLFYSGPGGYIDKARRKAASMGLKILEDSWKDKRFPDKYQASLDAASMKKFWDNASEALAEMSSGTIYVLVPADTVGTNFFAGAIWARIEWPALKKNSKVTKVVKVNPDNNKEEVIKGAGAGGSSRSSSPSRPGSPNAKSKPRRNSKV